MDEKMINCNYSILLKMIDLYKIKVIFNADNSRSVFFVTICKETCKLTQEMFMR